MSLKKYREAQGEAFKAINELFTAVSMGWLYRIDKELKAVTRATEKMKRYAKDTT